MNGRESALVLALGFGAGVVGGWSATYFAGNPAQAQEQAAPNVVSAERFEVVDRNGNRRIVIGPDLITIDTDQQRALLGSSGLLFSEVVVENTVDASLSAKGLLVMESGKVRLDLSMKNGEPGLRLKDQSGRLRAAVGPVDVRKNEESVPEHRPLASLVLFDDGGKPMWAAP
jgi:hypothetical protein